MRVGTVRSQQAPLGWILWAVSILGIGFSAWRYAALRPDSGRMVGDLTFALILFALTAGASTAEHLAPSARRFRVALVVRAVTVLGLLVFVAGRFEIEIVLASGLLIETAIYEPYPRNAALCAAALFGMLGTRSWVSAESLGHPSSEALLEQVPFAVIGSLIVGPAVLFTRYREDIIAVQRDKRRLDEVVVELAKANLQYQDFAAEASESGMRDERLRITRDIHDIVGYTLTNNIAMMEAATDMMRRSPLGVPALINAARDNAQEGLSQIREALYRLRAQGEQSPRGLRALTRLCKLFERATQIEVTLSFGNARWEYGDVVDSAMHHLVQEALLNAFRHGRSSRATVALWEEAGGVNVTVRDDGLGAVSFVEGIGLRGMRERVEALAGRLNVEARPGLFRVTAWLPVGERGDV